MQIRQIIRRPNCRESGFVQSTLSTGPSLRPKCRMIHDGRLSIAELTTLAFASSRGSDRLFLLSSLGADIEGPKQF